MLIQLCMPRSDLHFSQHIQCIVHFISVNILLKNFGKKFREFSVQFYAVRNTLQKPHFESKWQALIKQYPEAQQYLVNVLYNTKEAWAHPWTCRHFTAGLHASSPVESINSWLKHY